MRYLEGLMLDLGLHSGELGDLLLDICGLDVSLLGRPSDGLRRGLATHHGPGGARAGLAPATPST